MWDLVSLRVKKVTTLCKSPGIGDCLHGNSPVVFEKIEFFTINIELQDGCIPAALSVSGCNIIDEKSKVFDFSIHLL
jgi:hypothetical protein